MQTIYYVRIHLVFNIITKTYKSKVYTLANINCMIKKIYKVNLVGRNQLQKVPVVEFTKTMLTWNSFCFLLDKCNFSSLKDRNLLVNIFNSTFLPFYDPVIYTLTQRRLIHKNYILETNVSYWGTYLLQSVQVNLPKCLSNKESHKNKFVFSYSNTTQ